MLCSWHQTSTATASLHAHVQAQKDHVDECCPPPAILAVQWLQTYLPPLRSPKGHPPSLLHRITHQGIATGIQQCSLEGDITNTSHILSMINTQLNMWQSRVNYIHYSVLISLNGPRRLCQFRVNAFKLCHIAAPRPNAVMWLVLTLSPLQQLRGRF